MEEANVDVLIDQMKTDCKPPLHIEHIKQILTMLESSIHELQLNSVTSAEHQEVMDKLKRIQNTLSSENLNGE